MHLMSSCIFKEEMDIEEKSLCGSCVKICPMSARNVDGISANINFEKCVGCGRCAEECPASVIQLKEG